MDEKNPWHNRGRKLRADSLAFAIPTVLFSFPVIGALLGKWAGEYLELPWLLLVGLAGGLLGGIREAIRILRLLNKIQSDDEPKG